MSEYIGNCPHCGQINPHKTDCHWSCFERNHELQSQLAASQEELRKAQEEIERLKAKVKDSCWETPCEEVARLRGILERIESLVAVEPNYSFSGYHEGLKKAAAIAAEGKAK